MRPYLYLYTKAESKNDDSLLHIVFSTFQVGKALWSLFLQYTFTRTIFRAVKCNRYIGLEQLFVTEREREIKDAIMIDS
jgi:hypothetical protein